MKQGFKVLPHSLIQTINQFDDFPEFAFVFEDTEYTTVIHRCKRRLGQHGFVDNAVFVQIIDQQLA